MEAEVFIKVGAWKNFEDLEESVTLIELDALLKAIRMDQEDTRVFQAALQGIDLKANAVDPIEEKRREIERRAMEKQIGFEAVERQELADFGFDFAAD